jgi:hypothetical protein
VRSAQYNNRGTWGIISVYSLEDRVKPSKTCVEIGGPGTFPFIFTFHLRLLTLNLPLKCWARKHGRVARVLHTPPPPSQGTARCVAHSCGTYHQEQVIEHLWSVFRRDGQIRWYVFQKYTVTFLILRREAGRKCFPDGVTSKVPYVRVFSSGMWRRIVWNRQHTAAISDVQANSLQNPEDGDSSFLWNVGKLLPDYTASYPRR